MSCCNNIVHGCINKVSEQSEDNIKILNVISHNNIVHGIIYYDVYKDMLYFKNKKNVDYELFSSSRNISIPEITPKIVPPIIQSAKPFNFRGKWNIGDRYNKNDIVSHPDTNDLLIARENINNNIDPLQNNNWMIILPYPKINEEQNQEINIFEEKENNDLKSDISDILRVWNSNTTYVKGSCVVYDSIIYKCVKSNKNSIPTENLSDWNQMCKVDKSNLYNVPIFYGILVSNDSKYTLDKQKKISIVDEQTESISEEKIKSDADLFQDIEFELVMKDCKENQDCKKFDGLKIPINFVGKNNVDYYDYISASKNFFIIKSGYYRITYNIVFIGNFNEVKTYVNMNWGNRKENSEQVCASIKYESCFPGKYKYINHTFPLPVSKPGNNRIDLMCTLITYSNDAKQKIKLIPVNTWINVELISDVV